MKPNNFSKTVGNVEVEARVITLHHSFAEVDAKTTGDTLGDVKAKALPDTLAERAAEVKAGKFVKTLTDLKAALPFVTLLKH